MQAVAPAVVLSAATPTFERKVEWCIDNGCDGETGGTLEILNCPKNAKIVNLKNSNSSVVKVVKRKLKKAPCITIFPLKKV